MITNEAWLKLADQFDALTEIVDALANTLSKQHPENDALKSIADRARRLYQERAE